jgi:hypothetical protein
LAVPAIDAAVWAEAPAATNSNAINTSACVATLFIDFFIDSLRCVLVTTE